MNESIINQTFDNERALYNIKNAEISGCTFAGASDGESVLKEGRNYTVTNSTFSLRYPMWHAKGFCLSKSTMDEKARAPLWYCKNGSVEQCRVTSVKFLRESTDVSIVSSFIDTEEFGWKCSNLKIRDSQINSVYCLFESNNVDIKNLKMQGKYSFQYMDEVKMQDCELDTKDAFWHSRNVTVENSTLKGEYLGWFSKNLTLVNCHISGTQPLCYCKNLTLINCTMENTDLAFEYSDVNADIKGSVLSIKNPASGVIIADSVGEIINDDPVMDCRGLIRIR